MELENENLLIGVFIALMFIVMALVHMRENANIEKKYKDKLEPEIAKWLVRFAWSRTLQLLCALGGCIVLFMNYDKALTETRESLDNLTHIVEQKAREETQKPKPALAAAPQTAPAAAPVAAVQPVAASAPAQATLQPAAASAQQQVTPPPGDEKAINKALQASNAPDEPPGSENIIISNVSESPATAGNETVEAIQSDFSYGSDPELDDISPNRNETIEALYNPERDQQDMQSGMDDIKKRYEDILVIHLFLKKCNKVPPEGLAIITNAITQEIKTLQAPPELQQNIMESARGSYREIYARSPCNGKGISNLITQYNDYLAVLQNNFRQQ